MASSTDNKKNYLEKVQEALELYAKRRGFLSFFRSVTQSEETKKLIEELNLAIFKKDPDKAKELISSICQSPSYETTFKRILVDFKLIKPRTVSTDSLGEIVVQYQAGSP